MKFLIKDQRPLISEILNHPWFSCHSIPSSLSESSLTSVPSLLKPSNILKPHNSNVAFKKPEINEWNVKVCKSSEARDVFSDEAVKHSAEKRLPPTPKENLSPQVAERKGNYPKEPVLSNFENKTGTVRLASKNTMESDNIKKVINDDLKKKTGKEMLHKVNNNIEYPARNGLGFKDPSELLVKPLGSKVEERIDITPLESPPKSSLVHLTPKGSTGRKSMMDLIFTHLNDGLLSLKNGTLSSIQTKLSSSQVETPKLFISKWIDYSNKYGLGYQLTDGSVGVNFNDSTNIILAPNEQNFEYLEYARGTEKTVMNRFAYKIKGHPETLKKKVTLLNHFKGYMQDNLFKASQYTFKDEEKSAGMEFLLKYIRTKHAVLFRLSNRIIQVLLLLIF